MLALNVLRQYLKCHVLIVLATDSKYAQRLIGIQNPRSERGPVHTPASRTLAPRISTFTYPGGIEHVGIVRADLRPLLQDCPLADEVVLCASELAANATLHSRSRRPGGTFTVRIRINPRDHVQIEVEDDGGAWVPTANDSTGHHGLDIVRALATAWGIDGDPMTRTIWARFDWHDSR
jgi:serine/threonine-protein kinase RsbW